MNFFQSLFGGSSVGTDQLRQIVRDGAFLVDVRSPEEFAAGSVPGAVNIPLDTVPARISEFQNKGPIVVFCRSGNRSGQAKAILEQNGIQNVHNGGAWEDVMALLQ
ncbi:MAG: rhodanese-like domain-containing protein [Chitinophagales bacterium]|nr:rhodanese-like domain-containing protein [Chitinophagales bacterium]MDW8426983.1 rhodanese-like domain-containing protein [Chitinophagales bacterium]